MKISKKMRDEIECLKFFVTGKCDWTEPAEEDIIKYFEWSTQGKHKDMIDHRDKGKYNGFETLLWANTWRNRHVYEMYEPGILEGMGYASIIENDTPRVVIDYLKKTMFQGRDAEMIEEVYQGAL